MNTPRFAIVTPSFNQATYLEETITSVLAQNYKHVDYIIMDGGSTDASLKIIQKYSEHLVHWESAPDKGQADAINRGFARSTGDILAWINSDDTFEPDASASVAAAFRNHPEIDLVYGEGWYIDDHGQRVRPCKFVRPHFQRAYIANKDPILQQSAFWRRSLWERVGSLDTTLNWVFDWDWFLRSHAIGRFHYLPQFLANYRVHSLAKTRSNDIRRRIEQRNITCNYGRWWHPNAIVQQFRILECRSPLVFKPFSRLLCRTAEAVFYGRYTS